MAIRTTKLYEGTAVFQTKYAGAIDLATEMAAGTAIAALLALDVSSAPPTAVQLHAAKLEYDAKRNTAAYEGATAPALTDTNAWLEIADEAGGGSATTTVSERYSAYWALKAKLTDLAALKTAIQADTDIDIVADVILDGGASATALQLHDAKTAWDAIRNAGVFVYGGCTIPSVNVNAQLWLDIAAEAALAPGE